MCASRGIGDGFHEWSLQFDHLIQLLLDSSRHLRDSLFTSLERSFFFYNTLCNVPIVSEDQAVMYDDLVSKNQQAIVEVLKLGKVEMLEQINDRYLEIDAELEQRTCVLARQASMLMHLTSGHAASFISMVSSSAEKLDKTWKLMLKLVDDENRGVRSVAVDALQVITEVQIGKKDNANIVRLVNETLGEIILRLDAADNKLFRKV